MFPFCIVGERYFELFFHHFPGIRESIDEAGISLDFFKPIKGHINPTIDLFSIQEGHEVDALGDGVFGDICFVIHKHEPVELIQESPCFGLIAFELVWVDSL